MSVKVHCLSPGNMYSAARIGSGSNFGATPVSGSVAIAQPAALKPAFRSPRRVTITLPYATFQELQARADGEGRSLSNLAAFLLESALKGPALAPGAAIAASPQRRAQQENPFH